MENKICLNCDNAANYKCPKCLTFNCSVACFKIHKEDGRCSNIMENMKAQCGVVEDRKPGRINVFTTIDTVPNEKLQELEKSEDIRNLLKNPHLRHFLQEINSAHNSWNAMKLAMLEPLFLEFSDLCLKIIEPTDES